MRNDQLTERSKYPFYTVETAEILFDLVLDGYDDVRSLAAGLLRAFEQPATLPRSGGQEDMYQVDILERAEKLARETGRASVGDGLGRIHDLRFARCWPFNTKNEDCSTQLEHLLQSLEFDIKQAELNLAAAVAFAPLHARFIALR